MMKTVRMSRFAKHNTGDRQLPSSCARKLLSGVCSALLLVSGMFAPLVDAQNPADAVATMDYYLPQGVQYDPAIPTPEQVLGMVPGEWHVRHDQLVNYMNAVAEASDRVSIERFGSSYENRPLLVLTITSPQNHGRLEQIRQQHLALSDPSRSDELATADMPVVLYQGYSVHGNEPSGANAALLYVYHLAAARGAEIEQALVSIQYPGMKLRDGLGQFLIASRRQRMVACRDARLKEKCVIRPHLMMIGQHIGAPAIKIGKPCPAFRMTQG
jgi:hypothetical protein